MGDGKGSGQGIAVADLTGPAKGRAAAAWALYQQHWAAMAGMLPVSGPQPPPMPWGDAAGQPPWASWGDAPSWPWPGHVSGTSPPHPAQPPHSDPWPVSESLTGDAYEKGSSLLQQVNEEAQKSSSATACADAPTGSVTTDATAAAQDGDDIVQDIASAVQQFLAGDGDAGLSDSDSDLADSAGSGPSGAQPAEVVRPGTAGPMPEVAPRPMPVAPAPMAERASAPQGKQQSMPTPENVQDFLRVLRRRPLPAEITEQKLPHVEHVISQCITMLYHDRVPPVLNNVQRYLRERSWVETALSVPLDAVLQALLLICARDSEQYWILPPMHGQQPIILLVQEPPWFQGWVHVESAEESYGQEVWDAFSAFLQKVDISLPTPLYRAAVTLRQRDLPQLRHLSLAELEHIVRLSLGSRRLLCQSNNYLKPLRLGALSGQAQPFEPKEENAAEEAPLRAETPDSEEPAPHDDIADRDDPAVGLLRVMQRYPNGAPLSLMKRHLELPCRGTLSEAAMGLPLDCTALA